MNTNRNIPYNYNVKDIDWPGLKAVGISKEQLEADGNLDLLLQGKESEIIPLKLCTPVISLTMDATLKLVPDDKTGQSWKSTASVRRNLQRNNKKIK